MRINTFRSIKDLSDNLIEDCVNLHYLSLSYRSFITLFGKKFLKNLYSVLIGEENSFLVVAQDDENRMIGFTLISKDGSKMIKLLFKKIYLFVFPVILNILRNPLILKKIFETFLYSAKNEASTTSTELVVIAVNEDIRSKGIGRTLLSEAEKELLGEGIRSYKVTVHVDMEKSNNFYKKNFFQLNRTFHMYGVDWNSYIKNIELSKDGGRN